MKSEAVKAYEDVLERAPGMYEALYGFARLMADGGKGVEALKKIDDMIERGQDIHPEFYYAGGRICLKLGEYDRCQKYLDTVVNADMVPGEFFLLSAELCRVKGDKKGLVKTLEECTKVWPRFLAGWLRLSEYYVEMQHMEKALEVMELAAKSFLDHPTVMGNLAWLLLETGGDFDRALDLARAAYDRMPEQAWLMDTLGWAYYHKKIYSQAEWMLSQAEERAPETGVVKYHRGMTLYRQGKLSEARSKLESALDCEGLGAKESEIVKNVLAGLNSGFVSENARDTKIFDLDPGSDLDIMKMPSMTEDVEDILQPDWSHLNSEM